MNWILTELSGVELPDERFRSNLTSIAQRLSTGYSLSFSRAVGERLRKSAWRLFSRGDLNLLSTHQHNSLERCGGHQIVLAVEDTTDIYYKQKCKKGLGSLGNEDTKGLNMHTSMLLSEQGESLGIFYQDIWAPRPADKSKLRYKIPIELKESYKWFGSLKSFNEMWSSDQRGTVVKIADRESDISELYHHKRGEGVELLVRVNHPKRLVFGQSDKTNLSSLVNVENFKGSGQVDVNRNGKMHARKAQVNYYSTQVTLPAVRSRKQGDVQMNVIWVKEESTVKGAIDWALLTTLQVNSFADILRIVGYYTKRWVIERFHYILKSGMNIEKIQIDDSQRLKNVLQLYSLIAWHVLKVHKLGQQGSQAPAVEYFEERSVDILQKVTGREISTVSEFIQELAQLAGFQPTNQQRHPGEKTLWQAIVIFNNIIQGFEVAEKFYETG
jgi:hypothetical protein